MKRMCRIVVCLLIVCLLSPLRALATAPQESRPLGLLDTLCRHPAQAIVLLCLLFLLILGIMAYALRQRSRSNRKIYELLYLDQLTGTWNYNKFRIEAQKLMDSAGKQTYALVYTDIDRFHAINDTYGYAQGDRFLCRYAKQLNVFVHEGECAARIRADNFVALLRYETYGALFQRLLDFEEELRGVLQQEEESHRVVLTSGIYCIPCGKPTELAVAVDCANAARKQVKGSHKSRLSVYDDHLRETIQREQRIEAEMENALAQGQFVPFLQPQFDLQTGTISGMEALARWVHPKQGLVVPQYFIPLFEKNGFITELDFSIFEQVCAILARWQEEGRASVPLSCNFSRRHLRSDTFPTHVSSVADRYGVPYHLLQIEITESAAEENQEKLVAVLEQLCEMGFSIAMDDFGSGYSSLNLLKALPVDTLKLDKEFLKKSFVGPKGRIIIEGFVSIADKLALTVVCEGVETEEQAQFLRGIHCQTAQGFLYARPMPVAEAEALLECL